MLVWNRAYPLYASCSYRGSFVESSADLDVFGDGASAACLDEQRLLKLIVRVDAQLRFQKSLEDDRANRSGRHDFGRLRTSARQGFSELGSLIGGAKVSIAFRLTRPLGPERNALYHSLSLGGLQCLSANASSRTYQWYKDYKNPGELPFVSNAFRLTRPLGHHLIAEQQEEVDASPMPFG